MHEYNFEIPADPELQQKQWEEYLERLIKWAGKIIDFYESGDYMEERDDLLNATDSGDLNGEDGIINWLRIIGSQGSPNFWVNQSGKLVLDSIQDEALVLSQEYDNLEAFLGLVENLMIFQTYYNLTKNRGGKA